MPTKERTKPTPKAAKATTKAATPRKPARRKRAAPRAGGGQPTLLTRELQDEFVRLLASGNYLETAARFLGLGTSTVYGWNARGRKELSRIAALASEGIFEDPSETEQPYVAFLLAVDRADAQAEVYAVGTLVSLMAPANEPHVRRLAASNFLERRHRAGWGRVERQEVTVTSTTRIELSIEEQHERTATILAGLVEVDVVGALAAQKALAEGGQVADEDG